MVIIYAIISSVSVLTPNRLHSFTIFNDAILFGVDVHLQWSWIVTKQADIDTSNPITGIHRVNHSIEIDPIANFSIFEMDQGFISALIARSHHPMQNRL